MEFPRADLGLTALGAASAPDPLLTVRSTLLLNLFDDALFSAAMDRVEPAAAGFTWVDRIPGVAMSSVTLATVDGVTAGRCR